MTNNIACDIKNVNFSSLWPPTSYCYPLYIPDYSDKLWVYVFYWLVMYPSYTLSSAFITCSFTTCFQALNIHSVAVIMCKFISSLLISILGVTHGFPAMLCNKSPNIPFTVFQMRFSQGKLNLMCLCMLWPLIGCRCAWRKFLFITWAQFKGWITLSTGKITIQWIVLYVITTLIGK